MFPKLVEDLRNSEQHKQSVIILNADGAGNSSVEVHVGGILVWWWDFNSMLVMWAMLL